VSERHPANPGVEAYSALFAILLEVKLRSKICLGLNRNTLAEVCPPPRHSATQGGPPDRPSQSLLARASSIYLLCCLAPVCPETCGFAPTFRSFSKAGMVLALASAWVNGF
jgi:hypothetical protein